MIPKRIYIAQNAKCYPLYDKILKAFPDAERIHVVDQEEAKPPSDFRRWMIESKKSLMLDVQPGPLLRPLTRPYGLSKPEYYLYTETGCAFDCQYCFLQQWLSSPIPTIFVNRAKLLDQIDEQLTAHEGKLYIHAGEVADALAWDPVTNQSKLLLGACRRHPGLSVEMRTKSAGIDHLLKLEPPDNLVLSWTLAPESAIVKYEPKTAPLHKRIQAMAAATHAGYKVAIRFDPMICEGEFEKDYAGLVDKLAGVLAEPPVDVSAGSLRMTTPCLKAARHRFTRSRLFAGELVPCQDGKWRYARPIRKRGYDTIQSAVNHAWGLDLALCMEPD